MYVSIFVYLQAHTVFWHALFMSNYFFNVTRLTLKNTIIKKTAICKYICAIKTSKANHLFLTFWQYFHSLLFHHYHQPSISLLRLWICVWTIISFWCSMSSSICMMRHCHRYTALSSRSSSACMLLLSARNPIYTQTKRPDKISSIFIYYQIDLATSK